MSAFLDYFGIAVFAITGALVAGTKRLDVFGVLVVALITCLGGGTLRDLVLDAHPVPWIANTAYLAVGIIAALSTLLWIRLRQVPLRMLEVFDAIGLAFFTIAGVQRTMALGHSAEICLLMGLMTGVAGGVLRDIVCNEIPLIFHREIYATAAITGAGAYLLALHLEIPPELAALGGMAITLSLRLAGIYRGWSLPPFLAVARLPPQSRR